MEEEHLSFGTLDEAYNLLQNGIFVETSKGLVCMSLNDAISSDLNLSEEDLKNVASELISQQNVKKPPTNFDSDGFSSECSDVSFTVTTSAPLTTTMRIPEPKTTQSVLIKPSETEVHKAPKRRGGWPKGRKRKPELKNLPPKAPATGYNLYLNEQRKLFKDTKLVFHEITKIIGNRWSNLRLEEKSPYLQRAEEDKRRYRDELKQYRQSDAYRAYLAKKRRNRLQNNVLSESDMDATDEIDDEDNEELYCRTCDQWFHNLHNKREHLQGRQHTQSVAGDMTKELDMSASDSGVVSTSLDESSMDALPTLTLKIDKSSTSVSDCMMGVVTAVLKREKEIKTLQNRLQEMTSNQSALCVQFNALRERQMKLNEILGKLKEDEKSMEGRMSQLWQVPSLFIVTDFNTETSIEFIGGNE